MRSRTHLLLSIIYWGFVVYLFVPLSMMILMSFKDSKFIGFPINTWTADWYASTFQSAEVLEVFGYSLTIAVTTTAVSIFIALWIAAFLSATNFTGRALVFALACLPAVIPGILSAIALRIYAQVLDISPGTLAIILGHTVHSVPFILLIVIARLNSMPRSHVDAARDLGADNIVTFIRVTLPYLTPALVGGAVFSMLISFDDFVRSFFLGGYQPTLPVYIFSKLRSGMSPEINAISTVVLIATAVLGLWAERFTRRRKG